MGSRLYTDTLQEGSRFVRAGKEAFGTRQHIAPGPEGMIAPAPIPGTGLWVETNQSARSVARVIEKLLTTLGHKLDAFRIDLVD